MMKQFIECSVITIVGQVAGFYMGRNTIYNKERIEYIQGDTIREKIGIPIPYQVEIPSEPVYIYKTDTLRIDYSIVQQIDTAAILADWVSKRDYKLQLFDNKNGSLYLNTSVQYNSLQDLTYQYVPIKEQRTILRSKTWTPYLELSYSTLNYTSIGGGLFYKNWGMGIRYVTDFDKKDGVDIGLKYKF